MLSAIILALPLFLFDSFRLCSLIPVGERAIRGYSIATTADILLLATAGTSILRSELIDYCYEPTPTDSALVRTLTFLCGADDALAFTRGKMCRAPLIFLSGWFGGCSRHNSIRGG